MRQGTDLRKMSVALVLGVAMMMVSCSTDSGQGSLPERLQGKAVLRYRLDGDPPTLDVAHCTDTRSASVVLRIYDGLVELDPQTLEVKPAVARAWDVSNDGCTYTFHLRTNAYFHNGRKVTAQDFHYSFERVLKPETASERVWVLSPIEGAEAFNKKKADHVRGIEVKDDTTLVLRLKKPFVPFLSQLCMEAACAVPKEEVEKGKDAFLNHPVGCGPFQFVSWKRDSEILLERIDRYYREPARCNAILYRIFPKVEVAFESYVAGLIDFLDEIPEGNIRRVAKTMPLDYRKWSTLGIYYFGFNLNKPPFKDNRNLRQALSYAVNRQEICDVIAEGTAVPAKGILPPGIPGYDPTIPGYAYDVQKSRQLLAKAGYPNGKGLPPITLWFNQNARHRRIAQYVQNLLSDIGVIVKLKDLEWGTYLEALRKREPELYRLGWVADLPDADNFLYTLLHSSQAKEGDNYCGFQNAVFDSLVETARIEQDPARRKILYQQADRVAMDHAVWIMVYYTVDQCLIKPSWKGVTLSKQGDFAIPLERMYYQFDE